MADFIHLHNHSHYSLLDAICTTDGLIDTAIENNMPAIALTDHGVMYGAMEFYKKAKKKGVKPIIGCEVYIVTKGSRFEKGKDTKSAENTKSEQLPGKQSKRKSNYDHLVLLAKNEQGYKNLLKLTSLGHTEGFYYKPRIDAELLRQYSEGLVALSACSGGVVASHIVKGDLIAAREAAIIYKEIFDKDFYMEIQDHSMDVEQPVLEHMPKLAKELGLKLIATNDIHYIKHEHYIPHNIYLYISTDLSKDKEGKDIERDLRYGTDQVYFKSAEEMCKLFKKYPEAIESTLEVAEKCNLELPKGIYHMPDFPIPEGESASNLDEYLEKLANKGLYEKIKNVTSSETDRLKQELEVIQNMKFSGYFLIVADFIKHAKGTNIFVGPGRGSAAGSLVCYALGITNVNPLPYNLFFERFLNPERVSMPDIDIDFQDDKRDDVIEYSKNKYGKDSVCQIVTFNKLKTKAVLKDVGRVLNYPYDTINEITKHVPSIFGKVKSLEDCYKEIPEFKNYFDEAAERKKLLKYAIVLENLNKNASIHASGVVIAPSSITDYVPVAKTPQVDNQFMTQYDMKMLEEAGLIKMDFLGLKELKILHQATDLIEKRHGLRIDLETLPLDDPKTYELFANGWTIGIFQFSKPKMREYLAKLKPKDINDLAAMNALYRPGPMDLIPDFIDRKYGRKEITYPHPKLEYILKETYGNIVYQEQVMQIVREVAGYSLAKADLVRRAMGKKDLKLMNEQEKEFISGAVKNGYERKIAKEIFKLILKFADYGFNKSHSVAYSILAYHTAYLKTHYSIEFMTALLNCRKDDMDEMVILINECKKMKLQISLPDVNDCFADFTIDDTGENKILMGLSSIKNVGKAAIDTMVKERTENGKFKSFFEFCTRIDTKLITKKTVESLIYAGAFDSIEPNRKRLYINYEDVLNKYSNRKAAAGQDSLFGGGKASVISQKEIDTFMITTDDWSDREKLSYEKAVLGLYLSSHPLADYEEEVNKLATFRFGDVESTEEEGAEVVKRSSVRMCGIMSDVKVKQSKRGNRFAVFILEDFTGQGECIVFPKIYENFKNVLQNDTIVSVIGRPEENGTTIKLIVDEIKPITRTSARANGGRFIDITIDSEEFDAKNLYKVREYIGKDGGNIKIRFNINKGTEQHTFMIMDNLFFKSADEALAELSEIFGKDKVKLN
ncbi:MAG: DNA polymerase III subunit alpha [Ignavibacteriae bacterium]|nr:MAG: DNA polymerase III subunit alpha [Ignavibacteriota bacterium]